MAIFEEGVYAKVMKTGRIGIVSERNQTKVSVEFFDQSILKPETETFNDYELIAVELPQLTTSQLKPLVRGELTIEEVSEGRNIMPSVVKEDSKAYRITPEDLLAGLNVYQGLPTEKVFSWISFLYDFDEEVNFYQGSFGNIKDAVTEKHILDLAYCEVVNLYWLIYENDLKNITAEDLQELRGVLEVWIQSGGKEYPDEIKRRIVDAYDDDTIDGESEATQQLFKECLDYLCDVKNIPKAIQKRGYCYYTGTKIYPNDWNKARDSFVRYYKMTGDASAANTLGYIYYYGRCNGGVPEYEEAFKYFSIGHAYTYFESTYKLADMFAHGYGVVKDEETANHLYWGVYLQTKKSFLEGDKKGKFADAALRIGNCYRDGIGEMKSLELAYDYYLQAEYAIRQRVKAGDYYGDTVVYNGIQKALASVREEYREHGSTVKFFSPEWVRWVRIEHRRCKMKVKELKNGVLALDVSPVKRYDDWEDLNMLITVPKADYCALRKKIRIKTAPSSRFVPATEAEEFIFDHVEYDWEEHKTSFYHFEELVGELYTEFYTFTAPRKQSAKKSGEIYHFVSIRFGEGGRTYDYLCENREVAPGDTVMVNGYDGATEVEVVDVFDKYESELVLPIARYKSIIE